MLLAAIVKHVRAFVVAASLATGFVMLGGSPANAAPGPNLKFCLVYSNNTPYASKPVTLYQWNGQAWVATRNGTSAANGCGTFYGVAGNAYQYVGGYWTYNVGVYRYAWSGYTPYVFVPNVWGTTYLTGTGTVYFRQIYPAP